MWIETLDLEGWGAETGALLCFSGPPKGFVLVVGDNEAGKSTARGAISALLFGAVEQAEFFGSHDPVAIKARLVLAEGTSLELVRRRSGRNFQLYLLDDKVKEVPFPDTRMHEITGPLDKDSYRRLFCFDHMDLETGSEALLQANGDLGRILVQAALGRASLVEAKHAMAERETSLLSPRSGLIRQMIHDYETKMLAAKQNRISSSSVARVEKEIAELNFERDKLQQQKSQLAKELEKTRRVLSNIPTLRKLSDLEKRIDEAQSQGWIGDRQWASESAEVVQELRRLNKDLLREQGQLAALDSRLENELAMDDFALGVLRNRNAIEELAGKAHSYKQSLEQQAKLSQDLEASKESVRAIRASLGLGNNQGPPSEILLETLSKRAEELSLQLRDLQSATSSLQEAQSALERAKEEREALGEPQDLRVLEQLKATSAAHETEILEEAKEAREALNHWAQAREISSNLHWKPETLAARSIEQLASVSVPTRTEVENARRARSDLKAKLEYLHEKLAELNAKKAELEDQKASVQRMSLPSEQELTDWRARRDAHWVEVRRRWLEREEPRPDDKTLAENLTEEISAADRSADALITNADTLAELAGIERSFQENDAAQVDCQTSIHEREMKLDQLTRNWEQRCSEIGLEVMDPEAMPSWLDDFSKFRQSVLDAKKAEENRFHYSDLLSQVTLSLEVELSRVLPGYQPGCFPEPLSTETGHSSTEAAPGMLWGPRLQAAQAHTRAFIEKEEGRLNEIKLADQILAQAQKTFETERSKVASIQVSLAQAENNWASCLDELGLPSALTPQAAVKAIEGYRALASELQNQAKLQKNLESQKEFQASVEGEARRIWELVGKQTPCPATTDLIDDLARDLHETQARQARHNEILEQRMAIAESIEHIEEELAGNVRLASELLEQAAPDRLAEAKTLPELTKRATWLVEQIEPISERTKSAIDLQDELHETESSSREANPGHSLDELRQEANALTGSWEVGSTDALQEKAEGLEEQIKDIERQAGELSTNLGAKRQERSAMDSKDEAVVLEQQAASSLATAGEALREYIPLVLARAILARLEEDLIRSTELDAFLAQASKWFKELTAGHFERIEVEHQYSTPRRSSRGSRGGSRSSRANAFSPSNEALVLRAVRTQGSGQKGALEVSQLSEGTRDQLFLALRLAGIAHQSQNNDALPIILDDVLVNFDNDRASAALEVLAELGQEMQVLCFTHHRHLADLAKPLEDQGRLTLVEMAKG